MKHIIVFIISLIAIIMPLSAQYPTMPRSYLHKLVLENGKNPSITYDQEGQVKEYYLRAWINLRPNEILDTDHDPAYSIGIKFLGDGKKHPVTAVSSVQLGNFPTQWEAGEVVHMEIIHKKTGQKQSWKMPIPEGTFMFKEIDKPIVIPPYKKAKK